MNRKPWGMATKAIIRDRLGRCLAIRRTVESNYYSGQWDLPGGKVEPGESFDVALMREVTEETGLQAKVMGVVGAWERSLPKVRYVLLVVEARRLAGRMRLSSEHGEYRWVPLKELSGIQWSDEVRPVVEIFAGRFTARKVGRA